MKDLHKNSVSLWGRLGVQIDMTPEEFVILQKEDKTAKDLLVSLIKSDRCSLSGESYFPPEPNDEYLSEELGFDMDYQPIQREDDLSFGDRYDSGSPEINALRGNISNLRKELDTVLLYEPDYAPTLEKILAVQELELAALVEGVTLNLDSSDIIDAEHLDCFWYGGPIGSFEYKGFIVSIEVHGDVSLTVLDRDFKTELLDYKNKNNTGAFRNDDVRSVIKNDAELQVLNEEGRAVWSNNNWIEYFVFDENSNEVGPEALNGVLDTNNVLEAFDDPSWVKCVVDEIIGRDIKHKNVDDIIQSCECLSHNMSLGHKKATSLEI